MAKGLTLVTMMMLILSLIAIVGFLWHLLFDAANLSLKQRMTMNANEIAGVINLLQASPSGTFHAVELDKKCLVEVNHDSVIFAVTDQPWIPTMKLTTLKQSAKAGIIKTSMSIEPAQLDCKNGAAYIMRCGDTIKTLQKKKPCEI